jgi:hypothetical protein
MTGLTAPAAMEDITAREKTILSHGVAYRKSYMPREILFQNMSTSKLTVRNDVFVIGKPNCPSKTSFS